MTDNIAVTAGSGTTIATDDVGGVHYQRVKLVDGTLDSTAAIGGDATNGLDVDVTRVIPGTTATALGKAEDAAHSSGDTGVMALGVRNDAGTVLAGATGDYIPFSMDSNGALRVTGGGGGTEYTEDAAAAADPVGGVQILVRADTPGAVASTNGDNLAQRGTNYGAAYVQVVTSSGAFVDSFGGSGGTAMADDGAFTVGSTSFTPAGGTYKSVRDAVDDNDGGAFAMSAKRGQYVVMETPNADSAMDDTNDCVRTSVVVALPAGSNAIGKLAANSGVDIGDVDVTSVAGMPTGSNATQVQGTVAHDSAAANNPILNGGYAINAEPTAVANADVARLITDLVGKLITLPYANPENFLNGKTASITGTSDTSVIAAQGAGVRIYVTQVTVTNGHATVGTYVNIKDGTTSLYTGYAAAAGGGFAITFPVPLRLTANTALQAANETTGSDTRVSASGYKGV